MPTKEPADVFYATETPPKPITQPSDDQRGLAHTPIKPKPKRKTVDTPPGPINLELRTGMAGDQTRITLTQRIYDYDIQQTDDTLTITGYLKPKADQ